MRIHMRQTPAYRQHMDALYQSLTERWRTEDVSIHIAPLIRGRVDAKVWRAFERLARRGHRDTSMATAFSAPTNLEYALTTAKGLFPDVTPVEHVEDAVEVRAYIDRLNAALFVTQHSFRYGRLNRVGREAAGVGTRKRGYNRRFRFLVRLEKRFTRWRRLTQQYRLAQVARTKLALRVGREDFMREPLTACFIAYMTAKLGRRSVYTWGAQARAYDTLAESLLEVLPPTAAWRAVAYVHPVPEVLARLSTPNRGHLIAEWYDVMREAAGVLDALVRRSPKMDLETLVVRRGDDSSTFNEAAGAFNAARSGWLNTLYALNLDGLLERFAPPKALRLMAADVVYMHRHYGSGGLEPDTLVWQALPKPWDVMLGRRPCNRAMIEGACRRAGISGKGWITPRAVHAAAYRPTPELVHGVTIGSPALAQALRRAGYFAGGG